MKERHQMFRLDFVMPEEWVSIDLEGIFIGTQIVEFNGKHQLECNLKVIKQGMTLVTSHLQLSGLRFEYDEVRPHKVTVVVEKGRYLWAEFSKPQEVTGRRIVFSWKGEGGQPTECIPDTVYLDPVYAHFNNYCFTTHTPNSSALVLTEVGKDDHHSDSGLDYHGKFKVNSLLEKFTEAVKRDKPTLVSPKTKVFEIYSREERFELDYDKIA